MLKKIALHNFKSIQDLSINLSYLNVLTGLNGSGKSSVLQAIALLKQSHEADTSGTHLYFRGSWVALGRSQDVLFEKAIKDEMGICLDCEDGTKIEWMGPVPADQDRLIGSKRNGLAKLNKALPHFQFIQANRLVPATQYLQADSVSRETGNLGSHGELTVDFLARFANKKISTKRNPPSINANNANTKNESSQALLSDAVNEWLQYVSPGARAIARTINQMDASSLHFQYTGIQGDIASNERRPTNVGFGLTYILPIIVACLSAPQGALILLENPEAHLHPRGQSAMGLLLALCAQDGVQIIVETHSDHLLNGIRLAAKRNDIESEYVAVHYFERHPATGLTTCISPKLNSKGRFDKWPKGFFDEWDNALDELLGA